MRTIKALLPLLLLLIAAGCSKHQGQLSDYSLELFAPQYASGFRMLGAAGGESVLIESSNPWQGADSVVTRLFIARNGEEPPAGFDGQVLRGDARRIVAMSSTQIAMLAAIGEDGRVVGVSGIDFISNPNIQARRDSIGDVGYEGNIDYERLLSLDPDLVLLYATTGASAMEGKLRELGIPFMYVGEYLEESPLGKAEWMVPVAETVGRRSDAAAHVEATAERYNALAHRVATETGKEIDVMINMPYGDTWFMPSTRSYMATLIKDAGGDYLYQKNQSNASEPIDLETAYLLASQATIWLNPGRANSLAEIRAAIPKFADTFPIEKGQVYNNNARTTPGGGNDFYESGTVNPDLVLEDLVKIFHPTLLPDFEHLTYYKQLQ